MFSVTMIAASTSRPTAMARPPRVMVLMPMPIGFRKNPASAIDSRNRERHDQRRANVSEQSEQHDDDEDRAQQHGAADAAQRRPHQLRLVVDDPELDAGRQRALEVGDRRTNARRDLHRVGPELLDDPAAHDFAVQPVRDAPANRGRLAHVGDVANDDGDRAAQR